MDRSVNQFAAREGATVYGADGDKVGKIIAASSQYVVVEKGFFFPTDYFIPTSAIANTDGDNVYLNVTKDDALNSGWDQIPAGYEEGGTYSTGTGYADQTGTTDLSTGTYGTAGAGTVGAGWTGNVAEGAAFDDTVVGTSPGRSTAGYEAADLDASGGTIRVPVHEEELIAQKREVERGQVRIEKDVKAQEQVLEVPVTEERVRVTRHAVDRDVTASGVDADAFQDEVIDVPVKGEEVQLGKRVRVAEEVEIGKEQVQRSERVAGTVRREEVRVDDTTGITTDADADLGSAR